MYFLGISATLILVLVNILLRIHHQRISFQTIITISSNITKHGMSIDQFNKALVDAGAKLRDFSFNRSDNGIVVKTNIVLSDKMTMIEHVQTLENLPFVDSFEVYPS